jgi:cell division protein FtsW
MLLLITALLLSIGLIVVYAISPGLTVQKGVSANYFVLRQFIAIVIGLIVFSVVSKVPIKFFRKSTTLLLGASVISSLAVLVIGERINGAYRWIQIGGISFQPVELIKFSLILWLAVFLVDRVRSREINNFDKTFKPLLIALGIVGVVVAGLQSDLGSAAVIIAMMFAMSFVAGLPMKRILSLGVVILIGLVLAISTSAYRRDRVLTFLQPERDCIGAGYQTCQALIAVGSGGIVGQGLNSSGQAFGYLPEAANDSIFAIMAEKFGFLGMSLILGLFVLLYSRITRVLERTEDMESRLIVMGVLTWLSVQSIINIGAMIGLLPLKGITLPFISYGGTSVIFVSAAMGLVFNISRYTAFNVVNEELADVPQSRYKGRRMKLGYNGGNRR